MATLAGVSAEAGGGGEQQQDVNRPHCVKGIGQQPEPLQDVPDNQ